jgi:hypothetical protein
VQEERAVVEQGSEKAVPTAVRPLGISEARIVEISPKELPAELFGNV